MAAAARESVGRLLRCVDASERFHVERAIAALQLEAPTVAGIEVLGARTQPGGRLLTLADHKRIAGLRLVLDAVVNATRQAGDVDDIASRNLLAALTSALVARLVQNCSATKENCCVWNAEARKLLVLLDWMATAARWSPREREDGGASHSSVLELLLTRVTRASADKSEQLAAALVVFELVQLHRQRELVRLAREGSVAPVAASHESGSAGGERIKLTVLGLVALEALIGVFLDGVDAALSTLQRYHASPRKQLLALALRQLGEYVAVCRSLLAARDADAELDAALAMLCWHWNASAMLLCSRSDAAIRIRNEKPRVALRAAVLQWNRCASDAAKSPSSAGRELFVAGLRRVWILLSLVGSGKSSVESSEESRAFLTLLLHAFKSGIEVFGFEPFVQKRELRLLGRFLAEFVVQRSLALSSEFFGLLRSPDVSSVQTALYLVPAITDQLALLCVPQLDAPFLARFLTGLSRTSEQISTVGLALLFSSPGATTGSGERLEQTTAAFIDADSDSTDTSSLSDGARVFETVVTKVLHQMKTQARLTEVLLEDKSPRASSAVEALLFARLAPCAREDLRHLEDVTTSTSAPAADSCENSARGLFHALALQVLDPLEFKEVKMLAVEILAKMPPASVLPFVFSQLLAFLREEAPTIASTRATESLYNPVLDGLASHPARCGIVTAKLMVYYLNRVINEDPQVFKDIAQVPFIIAILLQVLSIPGSSEFSSASAPAGGRETNLLADLQLGCMDCVALLVLRDLEVGSLATTSGLLDVVLDWTLSGNLVAGPADENREPSKLAFSVEMMVLSLVSSAELEGGSSGLALPLQVRICGCNILLSEIAAGALQVLFTFIYKTGDATASEIGDTVFRELVEKCFDAATRALLGSSHLSVCMNALKVVGAIMGKFPDFFAGVSEARFHQLIRSLNAARAASAPEVRSFAQSLLNALAQ
ncbi:hypothetical protein PybrP1_006700 [[Pythium] brassicae (nom. inval.)]|nr:hypothetical protein PybrP1_006700 [[Pythium] brassicae (nom. inval.)]